MIDIALTLNSDSILVAVGHCVWVGAVVAVTARALLRRHAAHCAADKDRMIAVAFWVAVSLPFVALIPRDDDTGPSVTLRSSPTSTTEISRPPVSQNTVASEPGNSGWALRSALPWFVSLWIGGSLVSLLRLVLSAQAAARLRRETRRHRWAASVLAEFHARGMAAPNVWSSRRVRGAMVLGIRSPRIVIGAALLRDLPASTQADVALHESAHVRRKDPLTDLIQRVATAIFWVFPAIYWLALKSRQYRELACDEWVVAQGRCRFGYARSLLRVRAGASGIEAPELLALGATRQGLASRVRSLTGSVQDRRPGSLRALALHALPLTMPLFAALLLFPALLVIADNLPDVEYQPSNRGTELQLTERQWKSMENMLRQHAPADWGSLSIDRDASGYSRQHRDRFNVWTNGRERPAGTAFITVACGYEPSNGHRRISCDLPQLVARPVPTNQWGAFEVRGNLDNKTAGRLQAQVDADLTAHVSQLALPRHHGRLVIQEQSKLRNGQRVAVDAAIIADVSFPLASVRLVYHPAGSDPRALELYSMRCHRNVMHDLACSTIETVLEQRGRGSPYVADRLLSTDYEQLLAKANARPDWPGELEPEIHTTRHNNQLFATLDYAFAATELRTVRQAVACSRTTSDSNWQCERGRRSETITISSQPAPVSLVGGETFDDDSVLQLIRDARQFAGRYPDIDVATTPIDVFAVIFRCTMTGGLRQCEEGSRVVLDIAGTAVTLEFDPKALSVEQFRLSGVVSRQDGFTQCRGPAASPATHQGV